MYNIVQYHIRRIFYVQYHIRMIFYVQYSTISHSSDSMYNIVQYRITVTGYIISKIFYDVCRYVSKVAVQTMFISAQGYKTSTDTG